MPLANWNDGNTHSLHLTYWRVDRLSECARLLLSFRFCFVVLLQLQHFAPPIWCSLICKKVHTYTYTLAHCASSGRLAACNGSFVLHFLFRWNAIKADGRLVAGLLCRCVSVRACVSTKALDACVQVTANSFKLFS